MSEINRDRYKITLINIGENEKEVIEFIGKSTGRRNENIEKMAKNLPFTFMSGTRVDKAVDIKKKLITLGAVVEIDKLPTISPSISSNTNQKNEKKKENEESSGCGCFIIAIIVIALIIWGIVALVNKGETVYDNDENKPTFSASNELVKKSLSPDEYISGFKNSTPPNASGTVDELFRKNYGVPQYKCVKDENTNEKYLMIKADSNSVCESLIVKYKIVDTANGTQFQLVEGTICNQVTFTESTYGADVFGNVLKAIYKN